MLKYIDSRIPTLLLSKEHRLFRHVLLVLVVLLISINVFWDEPTRFLAERGLVGLGYFLLLCLLIYTNMYWLVPKVLMRGKSWVYLLLVSMVIFFVLFGIGMLQQSEAPTGIIAPPLIGISSGFFALSLFVMGLTTLQMIKYRMEDQDRIADLKQITMQIELVQLQEQINPHFLFNILNNANILASEDRERSRDMLLKLDDLLSYQIRDGQGDWVSLKEDIAFLNDYLALEETRRDSFRYSIYSQGNTALLIPPLLFIPFVENAVKHNPSNNSFVELSFMEEKGILVFTCRNPKINRVTPDRKGGLGLTNVKRRLDLLFGNNYKLKINQEGNYYNVKLEIQKWTVS